MKRWMSVHSRMLPLALATAVVYLTLSVSAAACLFSHQSTAQNPSSNAHHHTGNTVHSSLCAWACHANPTVDLPSTAPQAQTPHVFAWLLLVAVGLFSLVSQQSAQSRAPPRR